MRVIDFHSHIVPSGYPARPSGITEPSWPAMEKIDAQRARMVIAGKPFRTFESFYWTPAERVARLDEEGIDVQVISPLPELLSYWLAADAAEALTTFMNGIVADMVRAAPGRFVGFGAVALQEPGRAVRQLQTFRSMGLKGVHVGSHVNGESIADERFYPFFEAAEALGLAIFVHGIKPGSAGAMLGPPLLPAAIGVPQETAIAACSLIMTDILGRFPKLKLVFSHGGGTLGAILDRLDAIWAGFEVMRSRLSIPPAEYARRFYYDTVVFGPELLAYLVRKLGASQLLAGTDGPVAMGQPQIARFLAEADVAPADRERIAHGNAEHLLGL